MEVAQLTTAARWRYLWHATGPSVQGARGAREALASQRGRAQLMGLEWRVQGGGSQNTSPRRQKVSSQKSHDTCRGCKLRQEHP